MFLGYLSEFFRKYSISYKSSRCEIHERYREIHNVNDYYFDR